MALKREEKRDVSGLYLHTCAPPPMMPFNVSAPLLGCWFESFTGREGEWFPDHQHRTSRNKKEHQAGSVKGKGERAGGVRAPINRPIYAAFQELHPHTFSTTLTHAFEWQEAQTFRPWLRYVLTNISKDSETPIDGGTPPQPSWSIPQQDLQPLITEWILCRIWRKCM